MNNDIDDAIAAVVEASNNLRRFLPSGEELLTRVPDWAVRVRAVETVLADWRKTAEKSALEESGGRKIEAEDGSVLMDLPKYGWKFNTQRILFDVSERQGNMFEALKWLQAEGALKLTFGITKLRAALSASGIEIEEARSKGAWGMLDDLDGPHAGRQITGWTATRMSAEGAESKKQFMGGK